MDPITIDNDLCCPEFGEMSRRSLLRGALALGGATFMANFFLWNESGYFDTSADSKPLLHLWSLGIEEQYYIFWPWILSIAWRRLSSAASVLLVNVLFG